MSDPNATMLRRLADLLGLAVLGAVVVAIGIQDHSGALPLGLFNQGRGVYRLLSTLFLVSALFGFGVLALDLSRREGSRLAGSIRGILGAIVLVELLLFAADVCCMSGSSESRIGGPYVERLSGMGERVFLKKSHPGSPLGFRTRTPYARDPSRPRVLFLGDSYTEGSGRSVECNYPTVAEATLVRKLGMEVEVMNAGVGGYGPADALDLLRFLVDEGYRFDAVAFHLFLENDFTDNLPGTERRVLAGVNFRVPQSRFLRWFHPLNWRTFRFGLFVVRAGSLAGGDTRVLYRDLGDCKPEGQRLEAVSPLLRTTVMRRLEGSARAAEVPAAQERVGGAIEAMQQETQRLGIPFALVLFPDRALVDPELKSLLALDSEHLEAPRNLRDYLRERFAGLPVIDLTPVLEGEVGLYRARDTHLSDRGNDRVGRFVGERLAEQLAGAGLRGAGTEVRD